MTVSEGRIRNATLPEVELIQGIERRAESVFSPTDLPVQIRHGLSSETLAKGILNHNLWVSVGNDDVPVGGFALAGICGFDLHLEGKPAVARRLTFWIISEICTSIIKLWMGSKLLLKVIYYYH